MGNSQGHTRRFTISNEVPTGVIQVSDAVAAKINPQAQIKQDENESYWQRRMDQIHQQNAEVHVHMEEEYTKAFKEIEQSFPKRAMEVRKMPCQDIKKEILKCYKSNPGKALACAKEVEAFSSCVNNIREDILC